MEDYKPQYTLQIYTSTNRYEENVLGEFVKMMEIQHNEKVKTQDNIQEIKQTIEERYYRIYGLEQFDSTSEHMPIGEEYPSHYHFDTFEEFRKKFWVHVDMKIVIYNYEYRLNEYNQKKKVLFDEKAKAS